MTPGMRRGVAVTLGMIATGLLVWGFWPTKDVIQVLRVDLTTLAQIDDKGAAGMTRRPFPGQSDGIVTLEYPQTVRVGDSILVRLRLTSAQDESERETLGATSTEERNSAGAGADAAQSMLIQSRLDIAGVTVRPQGDVTSPWSADKGAGFAWTVRASTNAKAGGTAWVFVIPHGSSGFAGPRIALSAQRVEIASVSLLGASGPAARATGAVAAILAVIMGLAAVERMPAKAARKGAHPPA